MGWDGSVGLDLVVKEEIGWVMRVCVFWMCDGGDGSVVWLCCNTAGSSVGMGLVCGELGLFRVVCVSCFPGGVVAACACMSGRGSVTSSFLGNGGGIWVDCIGWEIVRSVQLLEPGLVVWNKKKEERKKEGMKEIAFCEMACLTTPPSSCR